jgi:hypothetical protein
MNPKNTICEIAITQIILMVDAPVLDVFAWFVSSAVWECGMRFDETSRDLHLPNSAADRVK